MIRTPQHGASLTDLISASDVRLETFQDEWSLSCAVLAPGLDLPPRLYYRVQGPLPERPDVRGDAFVPPLLLAAAAHSRDLSIDAPVSPSLLRQLDGVLETWSRWDRNIHKINVNATPIRPSRRSHAAASFFSGGVDSFYSVVTADERYPQGDPRRIRFLVLCHGLDIPLDDDLLFQSVRDVLGQAALELNKTLVTVHTNVRDFVRCADWRLIAYGPCLAGAGLCMAPVADTVYLSGAYPYHDPHPTGSHPLIDPLWSTEATDVVHSGGDATRAGKIARLSKCPIALAHLRVCWQNAAGTYNCGRCEKCLRTMAELELCGVLQATHVFPALTAKALLTLEMRPEPHLLKFWEDWLSRAKHSHVDQALCSAVEHVLARARFDHSRAGRALIRFVQQPLAAGGLTVERLKAIDDRLLGGRAAASFRRLRRGRR
jgi:hypothetical protein